jgi:hypothetical protein
MQKQSASGFNHPIIKNAACIPAPRMRERPQVPRRQDGAIKSKLFLRNNI